MSKFFRSCFLVTPPDSVLQGEKQSSPLVPASSRSRKWPQSSPLSAVFNATCHPGKTPTDQLFRLFPFCWLRWACDSVLNRALNVDNEAFVFSVKLVQGTYDVSLQQWVDVFSQCSLEKEKRKEKKDDVNAIISYG